jgi:hypothetical protein
MLLILQPAKHAKYNFWMLNHRFWLSTIITLHREACYSYFQRDPLDNPLTTHPIEACREISIESYQNQQFRSIDDSDRQLGRGLVLTVARTKSDSQEPLPTPVDDIGQLVWTAHLHWVGVVIITIHIKLPSVLGLFRRWAKIGSCGRYHTYCIIALSGSSFSHIVRC